MGEFRESSPSHIYFTLSSATFIRKVNEGNSVTFRNITISTSSISKNPPKNTDGWDIYRSDNVIITDSVVNNDDDCVSFKPSTMIDHLEYAELKLIIFLTPDATNILVSNLSCNGSQFVIFLLMRITLVLFSFYDVFRCHSGISVGSLGQYAGEYDIVQNVLATYASKSFPHLSHPTRILIPL